MKYGLHSLLANLPSLACVIIAGYMAFHDKNGWGWFLFLAVLLAKSIDHED
jgi:hypothetical protein